MFSRLTPWFSSPVGISLLASPASLTSTDQDGASSASPGDGDRVRTSVWIGWDCGNGVGVGDLLLA